MESRADPTASSMVLYGFHVAFCVACNTISITGANKTTHRGVSATLLCPAVDKNFYVCEGKMVELAGEKANGLLQLLAEVWTAQFGTVEDDQMDASDGEDE